MASKIVDIFDGSGTKLFTYSIALEDNDCLDAEFEEAALIFAEMSGTLSKGEIAQLSARCEIGLAGVASAITSAVCSPSSGGRVTSAGGSDSFTGQTTVW